ncbi:uncharacterized protein MYCFIDRAFT_76609 [Pseudocercospora fijiensis CIRAD86]|uniref:Uncharacterized protein n=1 Tax=Pseudocercospora fijiensis (strain CIRAD86) TaxID=383855 RepID=N1Q8Q1_PSEFD|nr:uncharacterized protein MYCFIDRAFT_76609 [Pseudocercospora fijiensis CIRAD86]EME89259.1 hypothetical protein MYCFIDRAFT_76609 [Pseudocercospora fijiensis CIRAD86]
MAPDESKKVTVNGTTSAFNPTTQDQITMALLQNGGIKRIQQSFQERLDEAGWSQAVRDYVDRLFRSGDAQSYDEAMKMVMARVHFSEEGKNGSVATVDLTIPKDAAKDAAVVVKRELGKVVKMEGNK